MRKKIIPVSILILSLINFLISIKIFKQIGICLDEYNLSPQNVYGSNFLLIADWLRLLFLLILIILSIYNIYLAGKGK